jgi:hypothetical protein
MTRKNWIDKRKKIDLSLLLFLFFTIWTLTVVLRMNRQYQDTWVLSGVLVPFVLLSFTYIYYIINQKVLRNVAFITYIFTFLINFFPALKYHDPYLTTIDVATHYNFSQSIFLTHQLSLDNVYLNTPIFHAMIALLAEISGLGVNIWLKIFPAFLGSMVPLAFYWFVKKVNLPFELAKWIIILSGISLPLLYTLNGTTFSAPIIVILIIVISLRFQEQSTKNRISLVILGISLTLLLTLWHPVSSFLVPVLFIIIGIFSMTIFSKYFAIKNYKGVIVLGITGITITLSYWMYNAQFVWLKFIGTLLAISVSDNEPVVSLIPARFFKVSLFDQISSGVLYHARDVTFLILALFGLFTLYWYKNRMRYAKNFAFFYTFFLGTLAILLFVLLSGYGRLGYRRFLFYVVSSSPILSALGLFGILNFIKAKVGSKRIQSILTYLFVTLIFLVAFLQIYPYQPILSLTAISDFNPKESPTVWIHQVNTEYQDKMLTFAIQNLPEKSQKLVDIFGFYQSFLYQGPEGRKNVSYWAYMDNQPSFILLHWPGKAGGFGDSIEYRSADIINKWLTTPGMDILYDNGGSYILYYPMKIYEAQVVQDMIGEE